MRVIKSIIWWFLTVLFSKPITSITKKQIENAGIISFDVFDTLVLRSVPTPRDVFDLIDPEFRSLRVEAEERARRKSPAEDITLEQIYSHLPGYDPQAEIEAELEACYANDGALGFYSRIKNSGKRVVIISDMYLPTEAVKTILANCGYDLTGVNVYVSGDYGLTKRTGNLFRKVAEIEGVKPSSILHIGDNPVSDYLMARKAGLKAVVYRK